MQLVRTFFVFFSVVSLAFGGGLDIVFEFSEASSFSEDQEAILEPALLRAEKFWESVILGRVGEEETLRYPIQVISQGSGLASASALGVSRSGDFLVGSRGNLFINPAEIVRATDGFGFAPGVNVLDELMAHEVAHALGMGPLWSANGLLESGTGRYLGASGLAAFREEFQALTDFVPVELAGGNSSANVHWDQLFRSSSQEGDPSDPLALSPLIGIVDDRGRDLGQDIMSPAIDPDFGEPFFSNTTVQAFRDIGFEVVDSFPNSLCDFDNSGFCDAQDIDALSAAIREEEFSLQFDLHGDGVTDELDRAILLEWHMDRIRGDANLDDVVDFTDFLALSSSFGKQGGWANGDFDGSGAVEFLDFLILSNSYGQTSRHDGARVVPEPRFHTMWSLLVILRLAFRCQRTSDKGKTAA